MVLRGKSSATEPVLPADWLTDAGEAAETVRLANWAATELGPLANWPQSRRTVTQLCLAASAPAVVLWGPQRLQLGNDAFNRLAPDASGNTGRDLADTWPQLWAQLAEAWQTVWEGTAAQIGDVDYTFEQDGGVVNRQLSCDLSPVRDEHGAVAGAFVMIRDEALGGAGGTESSRLGGSRAARTLRESERRLRLATIAADLGVFEWNLFEQTGTWENERMYSIFGRDPEKRPAQGEDLLQYLYPADREAFGRTMERVLSAGEAFDVVCRIRREDGEERWLEVAGDFQADTKGRPERLVGVVGDVTVRHQAEVLIDSQRQVLEWIAGPGTLEDVLTAIARLVEEHGGADAICGILLVDRTGLHFESSIGASLPDTYHQQVTGLPVDPGLGTCSAAAALNQVVISPDLASDPQWEGLRDLPLGLNLRAAWSQPIRDSDGRVLGTVGTYFKETREPSAQERQVVEVLARMAALAIERRRNDQARRESEERFRLLADAMPQLVWRADADGAVNYYNSRAVEYGGIEEVVEGQWHWRPAVAEEDAAATAKAWQQAIASGKPYQIEHRVRMADGSVRWHLSRAIPQANHQGDVTWYGTATDIDDQKRTEENLRDSTERMRFLIEATTQAIWEADAAGNVVGGSSSWQAYTGQSEEDAIGDGWTDAIHPSDRAAVVARWREVVRLRNPVQLEFRLRQKLGGWRWTSLRAAPLLDADGKVRKWVVMHIDISDRKETEEALIRLTAESERRRRLFETALSNSPDLVSVYDLNHRFTFANEALLTMWGKSWDEVIGKSYLELGYDPEQAARHRREIDQAIATKRSIKGEVPYKGTYGWRVYEYIFVPVIGADGEVEAVAGTTRDVTERRQAEEALRESEEFTRRVLDNLYAFVGVLELDGTLVSANRAPLEAANLSLEEVVGQKAWETYWYGYSESSRARVRAACERAARGEMVRYDEKIRMADDHFLSIDLQIAPLRDPSGRITHLIPSAVDITERKEAEAALASAKQIAEAANASKSEFLANMSHEIRTPMAAILGYADLLDRSIEDPDDRSCVAVIRNNGKFLLEIINDILDLSRIEAGKVEVELRRFPADALITEVRSLMAVPAREKRLPLSVDFAGKIPETIESDPTRLRQILINLVGNAIKFTEAGEVRIHVSWLSEEERMRFDVVDTGVGLTAEQQARLFQPFHQADTSVTRRYGGSGLGLAISRRLASMLGGEITVESELGKGSTFSLSIAAGSMDGVELVDARDMLTEPDEVDVPLPTLDCRVLVVDDRREVRQLAQHFIEEAGGQTASAGNGTQAIAAWRRAENRREPFDAILMDVQMPEMDGYEATRKLREAGFRGPIIAVTAHAMEGDRDKSLRAGCDAYLTKPIDGRLLLETLAGMTQTNPSRNASAAPSSHEKSAARKVLVVEDDSNLSTVLGLMLEAQGHQVQIARSGQAAIRIAAEMKPDVALMDLGLPDMNGREVVTELRKRSDGSSIVCIALSGRDEPEERRMSLESGFDHYLLKPPDFNALRLLIAG